jgi:hypothetical protein
MPLSSPLRLPLRLGLTALAARRGGGVAPAPTVLSTARILVDWSDAANHDGRFAVNENASGTPSGNLIAFPTGPITQESGQATPTRTNWYGAVTDPSGVTNNATRLQSTAANQILYFYRQSLHAGLPNGTYTLRFRARSAPGSGSWACSFGVSNAYASGTIQDLDWSDPANAAATTFTAEFSFTGTNDIALRLTTSGSDVVIDRIQFYPGTAANLPAWADEVFSMGRPPYSFSGGLALDADDLVDTNSSVSGMLLIDPAFPARHTYSEYTIISVNSLDSQSDSIGAHIMNVHPNDGGTSTGNILFGEAAAPYTGEINTFPSGTRSLMGVQAVGKGLIAIGQTRTATTRRVYFDTIKTLQTSTAFSSQNISRWTVASWLTSNIASLRGNYARGKFAFNVVFDRALTEDEYAQAIAEIRARLNSRSVSMASFDWHVISGDSNAQKDANDWSRIATGAGYHSPGPDMLSMVTAVGGQGINNVDGTGNRFDLLDGPGLLRGTDNGRTAFYHLCIGTNDWGVLDGYAGTIADQAAQYVARVQALIQRALDLNPRVHVIWYSLLPQTTTNRPNWEDQRLEVNSLMRTWIAATSRVHICDVGGSATIGDRSLQAGGGGTYYQSDEIHLSSAGDVEFAAIVRTSLATARAAAGL